MAFNRWVAQQVRIPRFSVAVVECERCGRQEAVGVYRRGWFTALADLHFSDRRLVEEALEGRVPAWPDTRVEVVKIVTGCGKCEEY